jgi:NADP-dependent 3-hydroxy acid dehydrogenase YdfG
MQRKVRDQEGQTYRADDYASPETVARVIRSVLQLPRDAAITEITVRAGH